jgi:hypothetical protein
VKTDDSLNPLMASLTDVKKAFFPALLPCFTGLPGIAFMVDITP